jgi:hypothetical protein
MLHAVSSQHDKLEAFVDELKTLLSESEARVEILKSDLRAVNDNLVREKDITA